jgi:ribosomal protein L29
MRKAAKELRVKTIEELEKESQTLRAEIAKMAIESKIKPEKDSNTVFKKRKRLAVILTMISQKNLGINK